MLAAIIAIVGVCAVATLFSIYHGWVLSIMWAWFVEPLGGPHIGIAYAIGLTMIVGMFTSGLKSEDAEQKTSKTVALVVAPLLTLLIGYIVKQFI